MGPPPPVDLTRAHGSQTARGCQDPTLQSRTPRGTPELAQRSHTGWRCASRRPSRVEVMRRARGGLGGRFPDPAELTITERAERAPSGLAMLKFDDDRRLLVA